MTDVFELLQSWRDVGVLDASDVHVAEVLARAAAITDIADAAPVLIGAALAARGPRHGHVCVDLDRVRTNVPIETDDGSDEGDLAAIEALDWPDPDAWHRALSASPLVRVVGGPEVDGPERPLVLDGSLLYLARYRHYESEVADALSVRAAVAPSALPVDDARVADLFRVLDPSAEQQRAAIAGATRPLAVVLGGPGTGKTRTVATMLALLLDDAPERFRVALAAPTGKAAARMGESITKAAVALRGTGVPGADALADRMVAAAAEPGTLHGLLGHNPARGTWRHDRTNPLVHDVVIVDETSMVSLPMMARLLDAVRPDARLVLVGDPGQLASVEAGSVLSDIAAGVIDGATSTRPLADCIIELRESRRFPGDSPIGRFAAAVRHGDTDAALAVLAEHDDGADGVRLDWIDESAATRTAPIHVHDLCADGAWQLHELAAAGDDGLALEALNRQRVLCAHRRGPYGVGRWNRLFEEWLAARGVRTRDFYPGRPVLVTANDRTRRLFNGDLGVAVSGDGVERVVFASPDAPRSVPPSQLEAIETVHAMTIHKSQGSEFGHVVVIMPPFDSRLATRELLYTAVTRATARVTVIGTAESISTAIGRKVERASGLARRLWLD